MEAHTGAGGEGCWDEVDGGGGEGVGGGNRRRLRVRKAEKGIVLLGVPGEGHRDQSYYDSSSTSRIGN